MSPTRSPKTDSMIAMADDNRERRQAGAPSGHTGAPRAAAWLAVLLSCGTAALLLGGPADANSGNPQLPALSEGCSHGGHSLQGRVKIVDAFPDLKVKVVDAFPDLNVQWVDSFADRCGRWQRVDSFPDLNIQFVDAFPDLTIREVRSFPGRP